MGVQEGEMANYYDCRFLTPFPFPPRTKVRLVRGPGVDDDTFPYPSDRRGYFLVVFMDAAVAVCDEVVFARRLRYSGCGVISATAVD